MAESIGTEPRAGAAMRATPAVPTTAQAATTGFSAVQAAACSFNSARQIVVKSCDLMVAKLTDAAALGP
jgi:hypothetical protein